MKKQKEQNLTEHQECNKNFGHMVCVQSSANENPAKDFNEWIQHVYNQVKINYERKLKNETPMEKPD